MTSEEDVKRLFDQINEHDVRRRAERALEDPKTPPVVLRQIIRELLEEAKE